MNRRDFLARLGGATVGAVAIKGRIQASQQAPFAFTEETWAYGPNGCRFRYHRATRPLYEGDVVTAPDGRLLGVSVSRVATGQCGWIQVMGPSGARVI